jgi:hypothetical protein
MVSEIGWLVILSAVKFPVSLLQYKPGYIGTFNRSIAVELKSLGSTTVLSQTSMNMTAAGQQISQKEQPGCRFQLMKFLRMSAPNYLVLAPIVVGLNHYLLSSLGWTI